MKDKKEEQKRVICGHNNNEKLKIPEKTINASLVSPAPLLPVMN